jgi:hypothetical protein
LSGEWSTYVVFWEREFKQGSTKASVTGEEDKVGRIRILWGTEAKKEV